jgi:hypothetical protein
MLELGKEERSGVELATARSPARPWRGGARSRQCRSPRALTAQRRRRQGPWGASGALGGMVRGETQRQARASSSELSAAMGSGGSAASAAEEKEGSEEMNWGTGGALGGVLRLVLALSGPTWPGRSGRRWRAAPRGRRVLNRSGHCRCLNFRFSFDNTDWQANFNDDHLLNRVDLARGIINKVVHLYANYNLYNWSSSCLGFVWNLQGA